MPFRRPRPGSSPGQPDTTRASASAGRRPSRRQLAVATSVAALAITGVVAAGSRGSASGAYRTATVSTRSVERVLDRVASIEPVSQASVAFPVSGAVASLSVNVGDAVATGQALASLDVEELEATLADKQAALDSAELTLERVLNGEDVSGLGGTGGGASPGDSAPDDSIAADPTAHSSGSLPSAMIVGVSSSTDRSARAGGSASVSDAELAAGRQDVVNAQEQVDASLAAAQQALTDASTVCAAVGDSNAGAGEPVATSSTTTSSSTTSSSTTSTPTAAGDGAVTACQEALAAVQAAQQHVSSDQAALSEASTTLDNLLAELAEELQNAGSGQESAGSGGGGGSVSGGGSDGAQDGETAPGGSSAGSPGPTSGSAPPAGSEPRDGASDAAPSGGTAAGGVSTSSPTSAELIAYQKAVDAAEAELAVAEQSLAQATVVSPIAGTVQALNLAVGDTVTAGSSTATIVVVGDGGYEVSTTVTVDDLSDLTVGQRATVTPDGSDEAVDGEVVRIGVTATSSGSSTSYPVTIGLTDAADDLRSGSIASVSIVTDDTADATAVPTSAVTVNGNTSIVTVLEGGEPTTAVVQVGVMGDVWAEIADGLEVGDTVVLADLDQPLPTSATDGSSTAGLGDSTGGRFPGGGSPGAPGG